MRKNYLRILGGVAALIGAYIPGLAQATVVPTSGWLVGPSTLVADDEGLLPCLMVNQFNNGFSLRISGGGGQIMGIALDTRQNLFTPGQNVDLTVIVPPAFKAAFKAEAYDRALLMVNTQAEPALYKALQGARTMMLGFDGRQAEFVMLGVRDGLDRIEKCYKPGGKGAALARERVTPPADTDAAKPGMRTAVGGQEWGSGSGPAASAAAPGTQESVASAYRRLVEQEMGQTMPPARAEAPSANDLGLKENKAPLTAMTGTAMTGAAMTGTAEPAITATPAASQTRLAKMLEQAEIGVRQTAQDSAGANAAPKLQAAPAPQNAQRALTAQESMTQDWLSRRTPTPPRQVQVPGTSAPVLNQSAQNAAQASDLMREWRAPAGHDLREILGAWTHQAQARLIWQAPHNYNVAAHLTAQGSFESAVLSLLRQFDKSTAPPLGQIYIDPESGQKVLVVTAP